MRMNGSVNKFAYRVRSLGSFPSQPAVTLYSTSTLSTHVRPRIPTTPRETLQHVGGSSSPCLPGRGISKANGKWGRAALALSGGLAVLRDRTELLNASRKDVAERGLPLSPVLYVTVEEKNKCLYLSEPRASGALSAGSSTSGDRYMKAPSNYIAGQRWSRLEIAWASTHSDR